MRRRWHIVIGLSLALGVGTYLSVPLIARRIVLDRLATAGWPHATVSSVGFGWQTVTLSQLTLDGGQTLQIANITARWDLSSVTVSGARGHLPTLDFAPLLPQPSATPSSTPTWPVRSLLLRDCEFAVADHRVALAGQITDVGDEHLHVRGSGLADGADFTLNGEVTLSGEGEAKLSFTNLDLQQLPVGVPLAGRGDGELRVIWRNAHLSVAGPVALRDIRTEVPTLGALSASDLRGTMRWDGVLTTDIAISDLRGTYHELAWQAPQIALRLTENDVNLHGWMQLTAGELAVAITAARDGSKLNGTANATRLDLAQLATALKPWWSTPVSISGKLGVNARFAKQATRWESDADLTITNGQITDPTATVRLMLPDATAAVQGTYGDQLSGTAVLTVAHATVEAPGISVASIDGTLPWSLGRDPQLDGSLQFSELIVHGVALPRLAAHARGVDGRIGGAASVEILRAGIGRIDGWYTLTEQRGEFSLVVPQFSLPEASTLRTAIPQVGQLDVRGDLSADGTLLVAAGALTPHLRVSLNEGQLSDPALGVTVTDLAATTTITGFTPLTTTGNAPINFATCTIGTQTFGHGNARVTTRLPAGLDITDATIAWCGGQLISPQLTIDLSNRVISGDLGLQRIELGALLATTLPRYLTGNGLISGLVPLRLTWPDWTFAFGRGSLRADPPPGWLHILDRTALTSAIATGIPAVDQKIVDTVADLVFDDLNVDIIPETPTTAVARVTLSGHGRTGDPPLAVGGFNVNLRGLEKALANALFIQGWRPTPPANHDLDQFFAPGP